MVWQTNHSLTKIEQILTLNLWHRSSKSDQLKGKQRTKRIDNSDLKLVKVFVIFIVFVFVFVKGDKSLRVLYGSAFQQCVVVTQSLSDNIAQRAKNS